MPRKLTVLLGRNYSIIMKVLLVNLIVILILPLTLCMRDPYKTLGIRRGADMGEIRKAYKQLAREWHPDKNSDSKAGNMFVEINQAYELLSDPERRRNYDNHGRTDSFPSPGHHDYSDYKRFDPFDDLFSFGSFGRNFKFQFGDENNIYHKMSISNRAYENMIVPKSHTQPHLILFYADLCFSCLHVEPIWKRIVDEMEPVGVGTSTVNAELEPALTKKLGIRSLPYMVFVIEGRSIHYKENVMSALKVVEFVKSKFPSKLLTTVMDSDYQDFLEGWDDNKVRVLIFGRISNIRLRYLLVAYQYREWAVFGYIHHQSGDAKGITKKFGVSDRDMDTVLVFHEDPTHPVATLSMQDIPTKTLQDIIENNKFLLLPRLSSQVIFDALCPPEAAKTRKILCVVLVTERTREHDLHRFTFRQYVADNKLRRDNVQFLYVYQDMQKDFVQALAEAPDAPSDTSLHVVIIWRRDVFKLKYEWLSKSWDPQPDKINTSRVSLDDTLTRLGQSSQILLNEAQVKELIDEHAKGMLSRLIHKILLGVDYLHNNVRKEEVLPAVSLIITVSFIVIGGYFMSHLVKLEDENIQKKEKGSRTDCSGQTVYTPQLKVHELRAETYNGLVRLLKPGCRTVVVFVDPASKSGLLTKFHRTCWPYRKNKTLMFAHMNVERGMAWYKKILCLSLPEPRELNINPKNCIGTVLALNGHRKYFCMYHAKHPEFTNKNPGGAFMGFDDSETETSDVESSVTYDDAPLIDGMDRGVLFQDQLLEGLPNWLDKLFEGTTRRYHINFWPDFIEKKS